MPISFQRQCFDGRTAKGLALSSLVEAEGHCPAPRVQFSACRNAARLSTGQRLFPDAICHSGLEGVLPSETVQGLSGLGSAVIVLVGKHRHQLLFVVQLVTTTH